MGLAIKSMDDEKARPHPGRATGRDARRSAIARRTNELNFAQLADKAAQEKTQRERLNAYNQLATTAKNDEDFLTQKIAKAKELGDGEGMLAARQQLATYKTQQLKTAVDGGLRRLLGTGDPTGLQDAYNNLFPDGNKVAVTRANLTANMTFSLLISPAKVVAQQPDMTVDSIGNDGDDTFDGPKVHGGHLEKQLGTSTPSSWKTKGRQQSQQPRRPPKINAQSAAKTTKWPRSQNITVQADGAALRDLEHACQRQQLAPNSSDRPGRRKAVTDAWQWMAAGRDTKETDKRRMKQRAMLSALFRDQMRVHRAHLNLESRRRRNALNRKAHRSGEDPEEAVKRQSALSAQNGSEENQRRSADGPHSVLPVMADALPKWQDVAAASPEFQPLIRRSARRCAWATAKARGVVPLRRRRRRIGRRASCSGVRRLRSKPGVFPADRESADRPAHAQPRDGGWNTRHRESGGAVVRPYKAAAGWMRTVAAGQHAAAPVILRH